MNKLSVALGSLVLAAALPAFAVDINKTIDAARDGEVYISNIAGSVEVSGWSKASIEVNGTLGRNVDELIVKRDGDKVKIKVKVSRNSRGGIASKLRIKVPTGSSLDIGTVSANIEVAGVTGEQDLASVSGDVDLEFSSADIDAESVSGNVVITRAKGAKGDVDIESSSVSGDVRVKGASGELAVESVSGNVRVEGGEFDDAKISSVNGRVFFRGRLRKGGDLSMETVNGRVDVELQGRVSARFDIDTFNGRIDNCFGPKAERSSQYGPGWELEFEHGGGDGDVEVSTLNGRISICNK